jgi:hypothetical protein
MSRQRPPKPPPIMAMFMGFGAEDMLFGERRDSSNMRKKLVVYRVLLDVVCDRDLSKYIPKYQMYVDLYRLQVPVYVSGAGTVKGDVAPMVFNKK